MWETRRQLQTKKTLLKIIDSSFLFNFLQSVKRRHYFSLKLLCVLVVDGVLRVVELCVAEDEQDV